MDEKLRASVQDFEIKIKKLKVLKEQGIISEKEFQDIKKKMMEELV